MTLTGRSTGQPLADSPGLLLRPKNKMSSLTYVFRCLSPSTVEELRLFLVSLAFAFYSLGTFWEACLALQGPALGKC